MCRIQALRLGNLEGFDCDGNVTEGDTCLMPPQVFNREDNMFTRKVRARRREGRGGEKGGRKRETRETRGRKRGKTIAGNELHKHAHTHTHIHTHTHTHGRRR